MPHESSAYRTSVDLADRVLDVRRFQRERIRCPRAVEVMDRWPDAECIEVLSRALST